MLYLFIDKNQIKLLFQKKTILSQYESAFYEKTHQLEMASAGEIVHMDFFASAVREALTVVSPTAVKEKEVYLILPQEAFAYMRAEVPADIATPAISAFIRDKARAHLSVDLDNCLSDYLVQESDKGKQILFYAIKKETVAKYQEGLTLLGLQIENIIPETLADYKLFEKTLRKDKKEYIMYASIEKNIVRGSLFDTFGPLEDKQIYQEITEKMPVEKTLKEVADKYEAEGKKLNRLILSGQDSEVIRQDTFTKEIGVWTNPLKRIIPQFYEDYLKVLVTTPNTVLPFLLYDICIGAFIFSLENKQFSLFKKNNSKNISNSSGNSRSMNFKLPIKEIALFVGSFALSFVVLMFLMKFNGQKSTITPTGSNKTAVSPTTAPTATPVPSVARKDIKVKVLNGTGTAGKASEVKAILKDKGYIEILTGNADTFDYKTTEIQIKPDIKGLEAAIKEDLKEHTTSPKITSLSSDSAADVVVIFGEDFK